MKKKSKIKIIILIMLLLLTTGCTKTLTDKDNKAVKNEVTQQTLTKNIICQPTDKVSIKAYEKNGVDLEKLPKCEDFKITSGKYEGLWTSFLVKPLAFILLTIGQILGFTGKYALSIIIVSLAIRLIAYPVTRKTALQSELIKKAQPELNRIQKKYQGKEDQESMIKQNQETLMVYKKYNINPLSSCLLAFIQLPLFFAFLEAINRVPAIFKGNFLGMNLGMTPSTGIANQNYIYIILIVLIIGTTYLSFRNSSAQQNSGNPEMEQQMKMMTVFMIFTISLASFSLPTAIALYWIVTNGFAVIQNVIIKKIIEKYFK